MPLRRFFLSSISAVLLLPLLAPAVLSAKAASPTSHRQSQAGEGSFDRKLLARLVAEETNRYRASRGREPLAISQPLMTAAQGHARAMASEGFFSHKNPHDAGQKTLTDRIRRVGLDPQSYAENIALTCPPNLSGSGTYRTFAKSVVNQWINSRGHRRNLLSRPFSQIGLGFAKARDRDGVERVYCVQNFCTPL